MHSIALDARRPTRATIVATVGPASESPDVIRRMIEAGVAVFRFNFSHGTLEDHQRRLAVVRRIADELDRPIAVLGDLCGPKIRVGSIPSSFASRTLTSQGGSGAIDLAPGSDVVLRDGIAQAVQERERIAGVEVVTTVLPTTYPTLAREVQPGQRVLINDGAIRMLAVERTPDGRGIRCRVTGAGTVTTGKGINLPDSDISVPAITDADWKSVDWAVKYGLDFLALSFVRRAEDVLELIRRLPEVCPAADGPPIPVIAKIEKPQAVADLDRIIEASDAIMVARGDLGVEMDIALVPSVQKQIVSTCRQWGKPCIVATQMLESMINASNPTRAEASDVANAVFDGADAVMLSGETAVGKHPALVVETMRRIIAASELRISQLEHVESPPIKLVESKYSTAALAHGAWHIANDVGARMVVCWSQAGGTARYLSRNDFRVPIIAYTSNALSARRMSLLKGVTPIRADPPSSGRLTDFKQRVDHDLLTRGWASPGEPILLVTGLPLGVAKATNSITIHYVGQPA